MRKDCFSLVAAIRRRDACVVLAAVLAFALGPKAEAEADAFGFYLEFLRVAAAAEEISEISHFMPSWWRRRYEAAGEADQAAVVARTRQLAQDLQDVRLQRAEAVEKGVRLHMTARDANDFPMRGEVLLRRVSDGYRLEATRWATSP